MKKSFILFSLIFYCNFSFAQPFLTMFEEDHIWNVDVIYSPYDPKPPSPPNYTITYQISVGNIETINGVDYYRILVDNEPACLLREENGIVYRYDIDNTIDLVLFDFNLEVGDQFLFDGSAYFDIASCIYLYPNNYADLNVVQVEFIEIAGETRKVITFDQYSNGGQPFQWIEGIGNITGFDLMWNVIDITFYSNLVCFTKNGVTTFFNNATSCDNTTLGLDNFNTEQIILYPNPVTDVSIIQFPTDAVIDKISIYDITGKLLRDVPISKEYFKINAMHYPAGMYFYRLYNQGKILKTDRFLVK